jgi:hypothetical protein
MSDLPDRKWAQVSFSALTPSESRLGLDLELLYPVAERAKGDAEKLRGCRLVVARLLERFEDGVALDVLELRA